MAGNIFDKLPKMVALAILLIKALDLKETIKLTQQILYLWREFSIRISIKPIIKNFSVCFYYKDDFISKVYVDNLKDILPPIREIEYMQIKDNNIRKGKKQNNDK